MSRVGRGAGLGKTATGSGVLVAGRVGRLVGVGKIVPVGLGKTGWKGVGVAWSAGWKGVAVGLAFGSAVAKSNGGGTAPGVPAQPVRLALRKMTAMRIARKSGFMVTVQA